MLSFPNQFLYLVLIYVSRISTQTKQVYNMMYTDCYIGCDTGTQTRQVYTMMYTVGSTQTKQMYNMLYTVYDIGCDTNVYYDIYSR